MIFNWLIIFLVFVCALICIFKPVYVAKKMLHWTVASLNELELEDRPDLKKRLVLMEKGFDEYEKSFKSEISLIRQSGYTGLVVTVIGSLIGILAK